MVKKFKVGTVQLKKDRTGVTVQLGNSNAKNEKYRTFVEIIVKDSTGKVLGKADGGYLQVVDPRKRDGITEEQVALIPEWVKNELYLVVNEE